MSTTTDKMDSALQQALSADASPVSAVVRFRSPVETRRFPTPDETGTLAKQAIEQATRQTGDEPVDYNVFVNMASMAVVGSSPFIKRLLENEAVVSATLNRAVELIAPVAKRKVADR